MDIQINVTHAIPHFRAYCDKTIVKIADMISLLKKNLKDDLQ